MRQYLLQRWEQKWKSYVDVSCMERVVDGDYLTVVVKPQPSGSITSSGVLKMIIEPEYFSNATEERVFNYLKTLIGSMKQEELRRLMQFVTVSSVMIAKEITVTFNSLDGL